ARKVQRFLSQPMYVAEVFTGLPGVTTPVEETVDSFEQLTEGELDDLPEQAFLNVGGAEDARRKAELAWGARAPPPERRSAGGGKPAPDGVAGRAGLARGHPVRGHLHDGRRADGRR